jgi:hypothetical protein
VDGAPVAVCTAAGRAAAGRGPVALPAAPDGFACVAGTCTAGVVTVAGLAAGMDDTGITGGFGHMASSADANMGAGKSEVGRCGKKYGYSSGRRKMAPVTSPRVSTSREDRTAEENDDLVSETMTCSIAFESAANTAGSYDAGGAARGVGAGIVPAGAAICGAGAGGAGGGSANVRILERSGVEKICGVLRMKSVADRACTASEGRLLSGTVWDNATGK